MSAAAAAVVLQLLQPNHCPNSAAADRLIAELAPGLLGCAATPSAADAQKPSTAIKDATVSLLTRLPSALQRNVLQLLQHSLLQAPDKAVLRNTLADATAAVAATLPASLQQEWAHCGAILSFSPDAAHRLLALQVLAPSLHSSQPAQRSEPDATATPLPCSQRTLVLAVLLSALSSFLPRCLIMQKYAAQQQSTWS